MRAIKLTALLLCVLMVSCSNQEDQNFTQFVDPFIGTADHGHTFPGATTPFGMVQLSPDNGRSGWDWCSGYNWIDSTIVGFSHKHLSGTGIGDLADILFCPTTKQSDNSNFVPAKEFALHYKSWFSHEEESATPGYYSVILRDWDTHENPIEVELTATPRVGIHKYSFPDDQEANVMIDLGFAIITFAS